MKRALLLTALLMVIAFMHQTAPSAIASQYCSTTCSVSTLSCNASTTCSSSPGTLTCCGTVYSCGAIDAYDACRASCQDDFDACKMWCTTKDCLAACNSQRVACYSTCGSRPQTSFTC